MESSSSSEEGEEADGGVLRKNPRTRREDRPTKSAHFGDEDFAVDDEVGEAGWGEVAQTCCCHTPKEWARIAFGILVVVFFLYWFLFGLALLGTGAEASKNLLRRVRRYRWLCTNSRSLFLEMNISFTTTNRC